MCCWCCCWCCCAHVINLTPVRFLLQLNACMRLVVICSAWQVAVKVVDLADAPAAARQALQQETRVLLQLSGECRHTCQCKGVAIKKNKFCLVMKRWERGQWRLLRVVSMTASSRVHHMTPYTCS